MVDIDYFEMCIFVLHAMKVTSWFLKFYKEIRSMCKFVNVAVAQMLSDDTVTTVTERYWECLKYA